MNNFLKKACLHEENNVHSIHIHYITEFALNQFSQIESEFSHSLSRGDRMQIASGLETVTQLFHYFIKNCEAKSVTCYHLNLSMWMVGT